MRLSSESKRGKLMRIKQNFLVLLLIMIPLNSALSADLCTADVVMDVIAVENPDSLLKRGDELPAITMYNDNRQLGLGVFCSHGGYCYPRYVFIDGENREALRLTNCNIGAVDTEYSDSNEISYRVEVDRSKVSDSDLREDDVENKLIAMGLCNACAANVSEVYTKRPTSRCAKLTTQALQGNSEAIEALVSFPDYCHAR